MFDLIFRRVSLARTSHCPFVIKKNFKSNIRWCCTMHDIHNAWLLKERQLWILINQSNNLNTIFSNKPTHRRLKFGAFETFNLWKLYFLIFQNQLKTHLTSQAIPQMLIENIKIRFQLKPSYRVCKVPT